MKKTDAIKVQTVIQKNTFYFYNKDFEQNYESYINSLKETLLILKNRIDTEGLKKDIFEELISQKENGLRAILALTGFSNEYLKRLITVIRIVDDKELSNLVFKDNWHDSKNVDNISEWSDRYILSMLQKNEHFRKGMVNLFFEGASIPFLSNTLPLFELKKLSISKLKFQLPELIDTIIRYKEKGSYSGKRLNNPETLIQNILEKYDIPFEKGDLSELISNAPDNKRTMDFIIPSKAKPKVIIECSFLATTSSGQGDKSKTEISIKQLIKQHYPRTSFIGFVDGIGWYVLKGDLARMVTAYNDVFTFHKEELQRFEEFLISKFK